MTKYKSFEIQKKKLNYITEQTVEIDNNLVNLKKEAELKSIPANEFYKNAKLIYESDWINAELEDIDSSMSVTKGTLLPERAKYAFSIRLNTNSDFLPYIIAEVQAKTNPDILLRGIYKFTQTAYKPVQFTTYDWHGITFTSGCFGDPGLNMPQPHELYDHSTGNVCPCSFRLPTEDFPVPIGTHASFELPRKDILGYENRLIFPLDCSGGSATGEAYWEVSGLKEFSDLITIFGLEEAKEIITDNYQNIIFSEESTPKQALEVIETERIVTGNQIKKFLKQTDTNYTLEVSGDFLLISPANDETAWSNPYYPTYQPHGGDLEVKLNVYGINPNFYSERKFYTND